ncbi:MAG: GerMN domain-containing protein [Clostridia bacterium]|jgi:germination protein M|nr:GerMN domain-containing protein [Clostridia bacterium]
MKNKKIIIGIIITIFLIGVISYFILNKFLENKKENEISEYIPAEEITQVQLRQTVVSLYFKNKENSTLVPEARSIDVKELTKEPYSTLINLLIEGPKNEKLEKTIPEGTKLNKVEIKNNIVYIDLSKEFIENHKGGVEEESKTIYSIVNTLTQLNEVEAIKIIIDGEENKSFKDNNIKFTEAFVKKD